MPYYRFSEFLREKYGTKVYKLPVNIPAGCPNRDGRLSDRGCIFCGEEGAGFECLPDSLSVQGQIRMNAEYIGPHYGSRKFIAYFQNFSNTYLPFNSFRQYVFDACMDGIVAVYISTRPDCISDPYLEFLQEVKQSRDVDIVLEIGLQTVNYRTLDFLNRGHMLAEFIDAVLRIKKYGLGICAHLILDLPMDTMEDVVEGARILSALRVDQVKCHSLYFLKNTALGDMYNRNEVLPVAFGEYVERAISFLEYLDPGIVVQRLIGRSPEERSLFCNWGMSWRKIHDLIEEKMTKEGRRQGSRFDYLNGKACMRDF